MIHISEESRQLLIELIEHDNQQEYWKERFDGLTPRDDSIIRGCFKELSDNGLICAKWADNFPYYIQILKDGYLYEQHKAEYEYSEMSAFERMINDLLKQGEKYADSELGKGKLDGPTEEWLNDVDIFNQRYLKDHPLYNKISTLIIHRSNGVCKNIFSALKSVSKDKEFINQMNGIEKTMVENWQAKSIPEYDVFISHANKDKNNLVEDLYNALNKLGIKIFYDKETLEWGDNWKDRILKGTQKSEFAIIVISENFFDREWTEKELNEFLNRQNRNGQKLILPIIHNITMEQLTKKYPEVADIQAIDSQKYSCDEIALMFAKQLIKRLKNMG